LQTPFKGILRGCEKFTASYLLPLVSQRLNLLSIECRYGPTTSLAVNIVGGLCRIEILWKGDFQSIGSSGTVAVIEACEYIIGGSCIENWGSSPCRSSPCATRHVERSLAPSPKTRVVCRELPLSRSFHNFQSRQQIGHVKLPNSIYKNAPWLAPSSPLHLLLYIFSLRTISDFNHQPHFDVQFDHLALRFLSLPSFTCL
jgi:hypothetical protein